MKTSTCLCTVLALGGAPAAGSSPAGPKLIASSPADGAVVPSGERVLVWTFDRPMRAGWSITGDPRAMPAWAGAPAFSADGRTFTIRMRLEPGRVYDIGVNSLHHTNFRDRAGVAAQVRRVRFSTVR